MERGAIVQQEPSAFCSKLWPHSGNALQRSSDNLNVESTVDSLPFIHKLFMDHALFVKTCDHGFDLGLLQTKFLGLDDDFEIHCMPWRFVSWSYWNTRDSSPVTVQLRKLGFSWQVCMKPWHDLKLLCFRSSVESVWDELCADLALP
jgi:hypothetical protein